MHSHYIVPYAMRVYDKKGVRMHKQVDQEERRRKIEEEDERLVTDKGVEAASLRAVAAEAGVSMGEVQHYYTTTAEM